MAHWNASFSHLLLAYTEVDMVTPTHPECGPQTVPGVANSPGLERQFESDPFPSSHYVGGPEEVIMPYKSWIILPFIPLGLFYHAFEVVIRCIKPFIHVLLGNSNVWVMCLYCINIQKATHKGEGEGMTYNSTMMWFQQRKEINFYLFLVSTLPGWKFVMMDFQI